MFYIKSISLQFYNYLKFNKILNLKKLILDYYKKILL